MHDVDEYVAGEVGRRRAQRRQRQRGVEHGERGKGVLSQRAHRVTAALGQQHIGQAFRNSGRKHVPDLLIRAVFQKAAVQTDQHLPHDLRHPLPHDVLYHRIQRLLKRIPLRKFPDSAFQRIDDPRALIRQHLKPRNRPRLIGLHRVRNIKQKPQLPPGRIVLVKHRDGLGTARHPPPVPQVPVLHGQHNGRLRPLGIEEELLVKRILVMSRSKPQKPHPLRPLRRYPLQFSFIQLRNLTQSARHVPSSFLHIQKPLRLVESIEGAGIQYTSNTILTQNCIKSKSVNAVLR